MAARRSKTGWFLAAGLCAMGAAGFVGLALARSVGEDRGLPALSDMLGLLVLATGSALWMGWRKNEELTDAAALFAARWRNQQWIELFGFAAVLAVVGVVVGVVLSYSHWTALPWEDALRRSLVVVLFTGAAGFIGGFATNFLPASYCGATTKPQPGGNGG